MTEISTRDALERLDSYVRAADYTGPDPYDGLQSPLARVARGRRSRQFIVQAVKRLPFDARPMLGVRPTRMAKALALFCSGLTDAPYLPDAAARADKLVSELRSNRTDGAWGYEFDVQTRWGFYPAGSPNIIATAFVVEALHDASSVAPDDPARPWLVEQMLHPAGFVRYTPDSDRLIHNANVLGARALYRLQPGHPAVAPAVAATVAAQRPDGLWSYGEGAGLEWVDNFHTAYVLLAMRDLADTHGDAAAALDRGIAAWVARCFEPDGRPRYYADRRGPQDVHNVATAVHALVTFAATHSECARVLPGALTALLAMQRRDGAFVARPGTPAYMRWNQGHAFRALAAASKEPQ